MRDKLGRFIKGHKLLKGSEKSWFQKGHPYGKRIKKGQHLSLKTEFKNGHKKNKGSDNPQWKGGRAKSGEYIYIRTPKHPCANGRGYVMDHRLVVEHEINRYLLPTERVHHLGKKDDNRPKMLMAFINTSAHHRFHKTPNLVKPNEIIFDGRCL